MPVKTFSSGMKRRLAFGISMAIEYDCYLIDEGFSGGDNRFTEKTWEIFHNRKQRSNMIVVSHNPRIIRKFCDKVGILQEGNLIVYDDLMEALRHYRRL
jgi:capsular polysaccharide transport system ATP-binding protein